MYKYGPTYTFTNTTYFPLHKHILIYPYMDTYIPTFIYLYILYTHSSIYKDTTPNNSVASITTYYHRRLPLPTATIYYNYPLNYSTYYSTTIIYHHRHLPLRPPRPRSSITHYHHLRRSSTILPPPTTTTTYHHLLLRLTRTTINTHLSLSIITTTATTFYQHLLLPPLL